MRELIGNHIGVVLKRGKRNTDCDLYGILVDVAESNLYIQSTDDYEQIFVVPRNNVEYCVTNKMPAKTREFIEQSGAFTGQPDSYPDADEKDEYIEAIRVFINKDLVAEIAIPPTFPVDKWNDHIYGIVMRNHDVKVALAGKVQKAIEYFPGKVYIETSEVQPMSQLPDEQPYANTFSMGGDPAREYVNPSQMVARLNSMVKKGNKSENKT